MEPFAFDAIWNPAQLLALANLSLGELLARCYFLAKFQAQTLATGLLIKIMCTNTSNIIIQIISSKELKI